MAFQTPLQIRRVNSAGILFSNQVITYDDVCRVIFEKLKIEAFDLVGLLFIRSNKIIVKFAQSTVFEQFMDQY